MTLRSEDPWDAPKLDIGFLSDKEGADLATLRCALTEFQKLQNGQSMHGWTAA